MAIAKNSNDGLQVRVHPTLLPKDHLLSSISGVFNAIHIKADKVGDLLMYGQGAGQMPTASAVISDIVDIVMKIDQPQPVNLSGIFKQDEVKKISLMSDIECRYYIRFSALDKPGVLSQIANILGKYNISIRSVIQKGRQRAQAVPIIMMTHEAREENMQKALAQIGELPIIKKKSIAIRVESF